MKLTSIPNFRVEDFSSEQDWIGRLFIQLNPFIQSVNTCLSQNLDYSTNFKSVTKDYDILTFQPFTFQWPFPGVLPVDLRIVKALKGSSLTPTMLQAAWSFNANTSLISITRMVELNDTSVSLLSGRYQFTVRVTL